MAVSQNTFRKTSNIWSPVWSHCWSMRKVCNIMMNIAGATFCEHSTVHITVHKRGCRLLKPLRGFYVSSWDTFFVRGQHLKLMRLSSQICHKSFQPAAWTSLFILLWPLAPARHHPPEACRSVIVSLHTPAQERASIFKVPPSHFLLYLNSLTFIISNDHFKVTPCTFVFPSVTEIEL